MTQPSLTERVRAAVHDAVTAAAQNPGAGRGLVVSLITSAVMAEVHRQTSAAPPPAGETHGLSVQYADALWDAIATPGPSRETYVEQHKQVCRAVARILEELTPDEEPTTDRAAEIERLRTENARMRHELEVMYGGAFDSPNRKHATGRAAVLREAADAVANHPGPIPWLPGLPKGEGDGFWWDTRDRDAAADLLRRMADEAQPAAEARQDGAAS
jgi:hypothetical protein